MSSGQVFGLIISHIALTRRKPGRKTREAPRLRLFLLLAMPLLCSVWFPREHVASQDRPQLFIEEAGGKNKPWCLPAASSAHHGGINPLCLEDALNHQRQVWSINSFRLPTTAGTLVFFSTFGCFLYQRNEYSAASINQPFQMWEWKIFGLCGKETVVVQLRYAIHAF